MKYHKKSVDRAGVCSLSLCPLSVSKMILATHSRNNVPFGKIMSFRQNYGLSINFVFFLKLSCCSSD